MDPSKVEVLEGNGNDGDAFPHSSGPSSKKNDQRDSSMVPSITREEERIVTRVLILLDRGLTNVTKIERKHRTNLWFSKRVRPFSCCFSLSYFLCLFFFFLETILQQRNPQREKGVSFFFLSTLVFLLGLPLYHLLIVIIIALSFFLSFFFSGMWIIESWNCCLNWGADRKWQAQWRKMKWFLWNCRLLLDGRKRFLSSSPVCFLGFLCFVCAFFFWKLLCGCGLILYLCENLMWVCFCNFMRFYVKVCFDSGGFSARVCRCLL